MGRKKKTSPISFFSFQDIMMCVCGLLIMITLLLCLSLINRNFGQFGRPKNDTPTTREVFDEMLLRIRELERTVASLGQEIEARAASADANAFLSESEIREKIAALEAEISLLQTDVARNETDIEKIDKEQERIDELIAAIERLKHDIENVEQKIDRFESEQSELAANTFFISNRHVSGLKPWLIVCNRNDITVISLETGMSQTYSENAFLDWAKTRPNTREYFVFYVRPSAVGHYERLLDSLRRANYQTGLDLIDETTDIRIIDKNNQLL